MGQSPKPAGVEILTPVEMYKADALAVKGGVPSLRLMENAGRAVTNEIIRRYSRRKVAVLCGPGNNGGDGLVIARLLKAAKWPVEVYLWGDRKAVKGDAALMLAKWKGPTKPLRDVKSARLVVDALFGAGLSRDFPLSVAEQITVLGASVVAVDVPSGLDGFTARPRGASVQADLTVTFFRKKPAHVVYPGRGLCGEIVIADIGIPDRVLADIKPQMFENGAPRLPNPPATTHKYRRGAALIVSGGEFATGASRLAAMAAARSGVGAVTIIGSPAALRIHAAHVSSIMLRTTFDMKDTRLKACCIGPGADVGPTTRQKVRQILKSGRQSVVVDASALTSFEKSAKGLFATIGKSNCPNVVLTPHEGEFSRLFKEMTTSNEPKHEKAKLAAARSNAVVVYKGADTVIAAPDGRVAVNTNGSPKLATAGSGDVLAGLIAGLLAQGMDGFAASCAAVWLHADAANRIRRRSIIAEDLIEALAT
jgi:ADP-dependent NAD(P)H-hydrate dehydratase / NAD(P)H-hydrate epimerase